MAVGMMSVRSQASRVLCLGFPLKNVTFPQDRRTDEWLGIELLPDTADSIAHVGIGVDFFFDFFNGVDGGGVVFAAEFPGDFGKAEMEVVAQDVHGDLARHNDVFVALAAQDFIDADLEMLGSAFDDLLGAEVFGARFGGAAYAGDDGEAGGDAAHFANGNQLVERALKFTNIGLDVAG